MSRTKSSGGASRKVLAGKAPRKTLGSTSKASKAKSSKSKSSKPSKSSKGKNVYRGGNRVPKNMKTPGWQKGIKEFLSAVNQNGAGSSSDVQQCEPQDAEMIVEGNIVGEVSEGTSSRQITDSRKDFLDSTGTIEQSSEEVVSCDEEMVEAPNVSEIAKKTSFSQIPSSSTNQTDSMEDDSPGEISIEKACNSIENKRAGSSLEDGTVDSAENKAVDSAENKGVDSAENKVVDSAENKGVDSAEENVVDSVEENGIGSAEGKVVNSTKDRVAGSMEDKAADSAEDAVADSAKDAVADSAKDAVADSAKDAVADSAKEAVTDSAEDVMADSAEDTVADSTADEANTSAAVKDAA